jgi:sarcosine oxidase subunit beta
MDDLQRNHRQQLDAGLRAARLLGPGEIASLAPELRQDDLLGGSFCSTDGFVDPHSVMTGFMRKAIEQGARLLREVTVTGIARDVRGVAGVETSQGFLSSRVVVNAAGPWAGNVARLAGVELPVEPLRRMLVPTEPFSGVSHLSPMVVDMNTGFHYRPEGRGLLLAWNDPAETPGFKLHFDHAFVEKVLLRGAERLPCLQDVEVNPKRAWAGLYEMTPDHHPVLGPVKELPGFFLANGFSGHGVMHSPATGRILADLILRGHSDLVDADLLGLDRFASGRLLHETTVL